MVGEEAAVLEESLSKVRKACKAIKVFCFCAVFVFVVLGALLLFVGCSQEGGVNVLHLVNSAIYIVGSIVISWLAMRIFSDIEKGQTPFSITQVNRIRGIAFCFLVFAVMDFVFSPVFFGHLPAGQVGIGFTNQADSSLRATIDLNIIALMMALLTYFFSVAFKYGALLQSNADDTL